MSRPPFITRKEREQLQHQHDTNDGIVDGNPYMKALLEIEALKERARRLEEALLELLYDMEHVVQARPLQKRIDIARAALSDSPEPEAGTLLGIGTAPVGAWGPSSPQPVSAESIRSGMEEQWPRVTDVPPPPSLESHLDDLRAMGVSEATIAVVDATIGRNLAVVERRTRVVTVEQLERWRELLSDGSQNAERRMLHELDAVLEGK